MLFLWNTETTATSREVALEFYDDSARELKRFRINNYPPYFLAVHPLSKTEEEAVESLHGNVELVKKQNLFTETTMQMAKVTAWTPAFLKKLMKQFDNVWESEVDHGRSFIYDETLVFGAPYVQQRGRFVRVSDLPPAVKRKFGRAFAGERERTPQKYTQIEEWFNLCHQPVPDVPNDLLGLKEHTGDTDERTYLAFLLARIANIPLPDAYASRRVSDWIKSIMYTHLRRNSILIPTSTELRRGHETHPVPGALTIEPEPGVYFTTVVCDFESLYPSCIDRYNLSYETVDCSHEECRGNRVPATEHHVCRKRRGFYAQLVGALKDLRIHWFKPLSSHGSQADEETRLAKAASRLLKLLTVSSYGVTVRIHGIACPPLAESITAFGRWALETTRDIAKQIGMHPIYGDTDSIFLDNPSPSQVQSLVETVKKRLSLDLAIQQQYTLCVLPKAKKAYFGIAEDGTPDLKGLTAVKSNAPSFIQQVFRDCVAVLSHVRTAQQYALAKRDILMLVEKAVKQLRDRRVKVEALTYSVKLYYDPQQRTASTMPQPYQCALQLIDAGEKISRGDIVHFVKVNPFNYKEKTFTVRPVEHVKSLAEINVEDYVRNLTTALGQTFEPMDLTLEKDMKLTNWFGA
jgi:DNA polymerase I